MRELRLYGSVRGAAGNSRPYRDKSGHKLISGCHVQEGFHFWTTEPVCYLLETAGCFCDHRRTHFRTPR